MKIVFVSNYINHHQAPFSDRLWELTGGEYAFIQTEPMEEERVKLGWDSSLTEKPYVELYYKDMEKCDRLIMDADCTIFGGCEDSEVIMPRLEAGKFTLIYSERIYKESRLKFISPRGLKKKYHDHVRFNDSPVYLLCAGAYVKGDFDLIGAYRNKKFKYGYFPQCYRYDDLNELRKDNEELRILWVGRFIDWKHPEMMVTLAENLKSSGVRFHITMIGNGEMEEEIRKLASDKGVADAVEFRGSLKPDEVREEMRRSDIFISTSDRLEGWGAVVNEAMNSGCVTIASKSIGSAPYLIRDGESGYLYKSCDDKGLLEKVLLGSDKENAARIGKAAYETIVNTWNPDVAAERIYKFATDPEHRIPEYEDGPLSRA